MIIVNVFDAAKEGNFEEFKRLYNGDINQVNQYTELNLLLTALVNDCNPEDKNEIVQFLLKNGIDINFRDAKYKRNALHTFFFNVMRGEPSYMLEIVRMLIENGIDINAEDKFEAIPLSYAVTVNKLKTEQMKEIYKYLLKMGADAWHKDTFGKSCIDYAIEYSWRNDFIQIAEEFKNGK